MKDLDQRIAVLLLEITEKLTNVSAKSLNPDDAQSKQFIALNQKLNDLVQFHRSFIKLQWGEDELVFRVACFVNEVMLPSISGPELSGSSFHYSLQTVLNIVRPIKGPQSKGGYTVLDEMDRGIERMRDLSALV